MFYKPNHFIRQSYLGMTLAVLLGWLLGLGVLLGALLLDVADAVASVATLCALIAFLLLYFYRMLHIVGQFDVRLSMGATRQALYRYFTVDSLLFTLYSFALCTLVVWVEPLLCRLLTPHADTVTWFSTGHVMAFLCYGFPLVLGVRLFYLAACLRFRKRAQSGFALAYLFSVLVLPSWHNLAPDSPLRLFAATATALLAQTPPFLLTWTLGLLLWGMGAYWVRNITVKI